MSIIRITCSLNHKSKDKCGNLVEGCVSNATANLNIWKLEPGYTCQVDGRPVSVVTTIRGSNADTFDGDIRVVAPTGDVITLNSE